MKKTQTAALVTTTKNPSLLSKDEAKGVAYPLKALKVLVSVLRPDTKKIESLTAA